MALPPNVSGMAPKWMSQAHPKKKKMAHKPAAKVAMPTKGLGASKFGSSSVLSKFSSTPQGTGQ